jgi:hypothetical protein
MFSSHSEFIAITAIMLSRMMRLYDYVFLTEFLCLRGAEYSSAADIHSDNNIW